MDNDDTFCGNSLFCLIREEGQIVLVFVSRCCLMPSNPLCFVLVNMNFFLLFTLLESQTEVSSLQNCNL